ncbi:MAG TPA: cupin domain-containing protein [Terriglobales bacterium]
MSADSTATKQLDKQVQKNRRGENQRFQLLTGSSEWRVRHAETLGQFSLMETIVPPGTGVPVHRHAENEVFYLLEGRLEIARVVNGVPEWMSAEPGDCIHVPGDVWHGFRNPGTVPARMLTLALGELGAFFEEAGKQLAPGEIPAPPTPEAVQHLREVSTKYRQAFFPVAGR